jgi:hypothetical protein
LDEYSKPMTLVEIYEVFRERNPFVKASTSSFKVNLLKGKNDFLSFGENKYYALRKWDWLPDNLKIRTINEMVKEFLETKDTPMHVSEIFNYVSQYKENTYPRSIIDNLRTNKKHLFTFYPGGFIGLKNKNYVFSKTNYITLHGSKFTATALKKYNGWNIDDLVNHFCSCNGYLKPQVEYVLNQKIKKGVIKLTSDNKIIVVSQQ